MSNTDYRHLLPEAFAADSRVWIYQSNRLFSLSEAIQIEDLLEKFTFNWQSHGVPVEGYANLFFGQFIVLMADESATGVSGCSTDSSVRLIKEIETLFSVTLFDRQLLAFIIKDNIQLLPLPQLQYAINNNFIGTDTVYFNNLVQTKEELENNWMIPVKDSWLAKRFSFAGSSC
ncbi:MAG TPA: hypothetical protein VK645_00550 [Chitinophagaceae bacterium]|nr:hypothetical protein [Chitinophagaceae bacterium]